MNSLYIIFFRIWAWVGFLPGLMHKYLDKNLFRFKNVKKIRKIVGDNQIECELSDHVQGRIYFMGIYEPIESYLFSQLIENNSIVIDAGANIGSYSLLSASKAKHVYSFEPIKENLEKLKKNIFLSKKINITVINKGLWSKNDVLKFSIDATINQYNAGTYTAQESKNSSINIECPVTTLDAYISENNVSKVDYIKMDIEGSELFALQGAQNTIKKFKPTILLEINKKACESFGYPCQNIYDFLSQWDYKAFRIESLPENSGFISDFSNIVQANIIFLNEKDISRFSINWNYKKIKSYFVRR